MGDNSILTKIKELISAKKGGKTEKYPTDDKTQERAYTSLNFDKFSKTVKDKVEMLRSLIEMLPEDLDYIYVDGQVDNSSAGRRLLYCLAKEIFRNLPEDDKPLSDLADAYLKLGEYEKSLSCNLKLIEKDPENGLVWGNIAWCQLKLGKLGEAIQSCRKAMKFLPLIPNVYDTYIAILACLGKIEEAISCAEDTILNIGAIPELYYQLGNLYEAKGKIEKAHQCWDRYLQAVGFAYGHRFAILRICNKLSRKVSPRKFITENKESIYSRILFANVYFKGLLDKLSKDEIAEKRTDIAHLIESVYSSYDEIVYILASSSPQKEERIILSQYLNLYALSYLIQEKVDEKVEQWLKEADSLVPKNKDTMFLLYTHYVIKIVKGIKEKEEYDLLRKALELYPKPGHAHVLLARYYCRTRKFKEIEKLYNEVIRAEGSQTFSSWERDFLEEAKFGTTLWLAVGNLIQGKAGDAVSLLRDLLRERPLSAEVKYYLTIGLLKLGDIRSAKDIFDTLPPHLIPTQLYQELLNVFSSIEMLRGVRFDEEALFSSIRSPKMTGCSSSPLSSGRY